MAVVRREVGKKVRWDVRWRDEGRHRSRTFDRKRDADQFDAEMRRRRQMGAHAPTEASRDTLAAWFERWWTNESSAWARSTRLQRAHVMDKWICPFLDSVRLRDLGSPRVREWRASILDAGCPPTQANAALRILSSSLGAAERNGLLPANPCRGVPMLRVDRKRPRALSPLEVERIRAELRPRDALLVSLMAYAGLRPQEAFALNWGSVTENVLIIDRTFTRGELRLSTKTNKRRVVEIVAPLAADLAAARPSAADPDSLVCPSRTKTPIDLHNWRRRVWYPARDAAEVKATPYDCRHTFASLLIYDGRALPYVTAAMGHASQTTTLNHYSHLIEDSRLSERVDGRRDRGRPGRGRAI